jgi:hypothetical protein
LFDLCPHWRGGGSFDKGVFGSVHLRSSSRPRSACRKAE